MRFALLLTLASTLVSARPFNSDDLEGIVGGEPVGAIDMYPFMAAIQMRPISRKSQFCGGSFIAPNLVLTAAHCTDRAGPTTKYGVSAYRYNTTKTSAEEMGIDFEVVDWFIHPNLTYIASVPVNDVAIWKVKPIGYNPKANHVYLDQEDDDVSVNSEELQDLSGSDVDDEEFDTNILSEIGSMDSASDASDSDDDEPKDDKNKDPDYEPMDIDEETDDEIDSDLEMEDYSDIIFRYTKPGNKKRPIPDLNVDDVHSSDEGTPEYLPSPEPVVPAKALEPELSEAEINEMYARIKPITLAKDVTVAEESGTLLKAIGWGTTVPRWGDLSEVLNHVDVFSINNTACKERYMQSRSCRGLRPKNCLANSVLPGVTLCAGTEEGGKDACGGDSGGPLFIEGKKKGDYIQVGVTSWGEGCGAKDRPGVYARVGGLYSWIDKIITEHAVKLPGRRKRVGF